MSSLLFSDSLSLQRKSHEKKTFRKALEKRAGTGAKNPLTANELNQVLGSHVEALNRQEMINNIRQYGDIEGDWYLSGSSGMQHAAFYLKIDAQNFFRVEVDLVSDKMGNPTCIIRFVRSSMNDDKMKRSIDDGTILHIFKAKYNMLMKYDFDLKPYGDNYNCASFVKSLLWPVGAYKSEVAQLLGQVMEGALKRGVVNLTKKSVSNVLH